MARRPSSVRPSVNFCANRFFSQANGRIATKLAHDGLRVSMHPGCAQGQGQVERLRETRTFLDSWNELLRHWRSGSLFLQRSSMRTIKSVKHNENGTIVHYIYDQNADSFRSLFNNMFKIPHQLFYHISSRIKNLHRYQKRTEKFSALQWNGFRDLYCSLYKHPSFKH